MTKNEHALAARMYLEDLCDRLDRGQRLARRRDWWVGVVGLPVVLGVAALSCKASTPSPSTPGPAVQDRCHSGAEGAVNCRDPECSYLCVGAEYAAPAPLVQRESACTDGNDNDGDGMIDCGDPDCSSACSVPAYAAPPPVAQREANCTDGIDDDGDGMIDCGDPDCAVMGACNAAEYMAPMPQGFERDCADGKDNDGDGLTDRADPDCTPMHALYAAPM